ncbi:chloroplast outer envelope protein 37 [Actinidia rufa]|uniref:Chloroplast outer envelope protein 37 n=1 Tax=Actinidia rufa TaxID=165716 RepID=A0A7J0E504_9ERIC|nr:chloroplast outer envelope protein 37 [Actinidia rufa]
MEESSPRYPNPLPPPSTAADQPPPPPRNPFCCLLSVPRRRPGVRVTTEFDSDSSVFFHKVSCKLFDSLAKLKLSFRNDGKGEISDPQLDLTSKYLSLNYDLKEHNAFIKGSFDVAPGLQLRAAHDVKAQYGEVAMAADLAGPALKFELSSTVPSVGLPKATFKFPLGEVSLEEKEEEEVKTMLSINGIIRGHLLNGVCTAQYNDENLKLRYLYKDEQMAFIPSISLPSNALSFAFKRRFGPSDKLSHHLVLHMLSSLVGSQVFYPSSDDCAISLSSCVGCCGMGKDCGSIQLQGWDSKCKYVAASGMVSFPAGWGQVGDECQKAKTAPMKMKVQFMLQVPQDDIKSSALMFRVKKRWDI